jgi:hypothetical protein
LYSKKRKNYLGNKLNFQEREVAILGVREYIIITIQFRFMKEEKEALQVKLKVQEKVIHIEEKHQI